MRHLLMLGLSAALLTAEPAWSSQAPPSPEAPTNQHLSYTVVRFHVRAGMEAEFERFFTHSLVPAAENAAPSPEALQASLDNFILLRPVERPTAGPSPYYVIYVGPRSDAGGEVMRDMVRRAFPPDEARRRVQRWMSTIDRESHVPRGEMFERVVLGLDMSD